MTVLIIEDEKPAYERLSKLLLELMPSITIAGQAIGVSQAQEWFLRNTQPDLVFLDVQLSDGTAFDLLERVKWSCPIVFTTAYDEFALKAFESNSIGYLLKPIKKEMLLQVLNKYIALKNGFQNNKPTPVVDSNHARKSRFLIRYGEHIKFIKAEEIAYFYTENKATYVKTYDGRNWPLDLNMDSIDQSLDKQLFFRINRQYIIHINAIASMKVHTKGRVMIELQPSTEERPIVSSERAAMFKQWLDDSI